jgi:hypothetical protein
VREKGINGGVKISGHRKEKRMDMREKTNEDRWRSVIRLLNIFTAL